MSVSTNYTVTGTVDSTLQTLVSGAGIGRLAAGIRRVKGGGSPEVGGKGEFQNHLGGAINLQSNSAVVKKVWGDPQINDAVNNTLQFTGDSTGSNLRGDLVFPAARSSAGFSGIVILAQATARSPQMNTMIAGYISADSGYTNALSFSAAIPADGKPHYVYIPYLGMTQLGTVTLGTTTFDRVRFLGQSTINDAATGYTGPRTGEQLWIGGVWLNPKRKPRAFVRFDDGLDNLTKPNAAINFALPDGTAAPLGGWSMERLCDHYGFKGSLFVLPRRNIAQNNPTQGFITAAELKRLHDKGWAVCVQTYTDPGNNAGDGSRLLGPLGYASRAISSVSTAADTITASAVHNLSSGYYGITPIEFVGTDLPSPLLTGTPYWPKQVTDTSTFELYPSENDALAGTNKIDITTTGTPANFFWRYYGSANDSSAIYADFKAAQDWLASIGIGNARRLCAVNQGAMDDYVGAACRQLFVATFGIQGGTRHSDGVVVPVPGLPGAAENGYAIPTSRVAGNVFAIPGAIQTDGVLTGAQVRTRVQAAIAQGGDFMNYHHSLNNTNGDVLAQYLDELLTQQAAGNVEVVTAEYWATELGLF